MREVLVDEEQISQWSALAPEYWNQIDFVEALEEKLQIAENRELFPGIEYLIPLVLDYDSHLLDYCSGPGAGSTRIILPSRQEWRSHFDQLQNRLQQEFEEVQNAGELSLPPQQLCFGKEELEARMAGARITMVNLLTEG